MLHPLSDCYASSSAWAVMKRQAWLERAGHKCISDCSARLEKISLCDPDTNPSGRWLWLSRLGLSNDVCKASAGYSTGTMDLVCSKL